MKPSRRGFPGSIRPPTSKGRNGKMRIWVDRKFVDRLLVLRGPGETYSDVILRLAEASS
jgi:hypothetical protein